MHCDPGSAGPTWDCFYIDTRNIKRRLWEPFYFDVKMITKNNIFIILTLNNRAELIWRRASLMGGLDVQPCFCRASAHISPTISPPFLALFQRSWLLWVSLCHRQEFTTSKALSHKLCFRSELVGWICAADEKLQRKSKETLYRKSQKKQERMESWRFSFQGSRSLHWCLSSGIMGNKGVAGRKMDQYMGKSTVTVSLLTAILRILPRVTNKHPPCAAFSVLIHMRISTGAMVMKWWRKEGSQFRAGPPHWQLSTL